MSPACLLILVLAGTPVETLTKKQQAAFEAAKKNKELVTYQMGACACAIRVEYLCLSRKKGATLDQMRKEVDAAHAEQAKVQCPPNAGCRPGATRYIFYCD